MAPEAIATNIYFKIAININGRKGIAMIDSGITGNFITKKYIKKQKYPIWDKQRLYKLIILDGTLFGRNKKIN